MSTKNECKHESSDWVETDYSYGAVRWECRCKECNKVLKTWVIVD